MAGNVELSMTGQVYSLPSHVCWKIKAIEFRMLVIDKKKYRTKTIRSLHAHPVVTPHNLPLNP